MRGVTIRQLQIFATAAAHLSFARTSEQLHLTQAAVSLQVKQLEDLVGLALFERRGRKVHLTEAGEHLVRYARVILDALRDADAAISALAKEAIAYYQTASRAFRQGALKAPPYAEH